jgi:hypothetical protein
LSGGPAVSDTERERTIPEEKRQFAGGMSVTGLPGGCSGTALQDVLTDEPEWAGELGVVVFNFAVTMQ